MFHIGDYKLRHLFDGFATLVRLHFENGRVDAGHAQLESEAYKATKQHNKICYWEFSEVPKHSNFFSYIKDLAGVFSGKSLTDNANVSVIRLGDGRVLCLTETTKGSIEIDPNTLETIGRFNYSDNIKGFNHSPHPLVSETEFITVIPDQFSNRCDVVRMLSGSNQRTLIGRVNCRNGPAPGWIHSFTATENYIIVPEMPLKYCPWNMFRREPTALYLFDWHPESKAFMHILSKSTGKTITCEVPLFTTFHFINAFEEKDGDGKTVAVIADCCEHYADDTVLDKFRLQQLRSFSGSDDLPQSRVGRFRIPIDGTSVGKLETALPPNEHGGAIDLCNINQKLAGKSYRYVYGCGANRPCNFVNAITKIDLKENRAKNWYEEGAIPSEPFFVARPDAEDEDDGVVISLVCDRHGGGFALVLDGSTLREIGRAKLPYGLPWGAHGCWIPS